MFFITKQNCAEKKTFLIKISTAWRLLFKQAHYLEKTTIPKKNEISTKWSLKQKVSTIVQTQSKTNFDAFFETFIILLFMNKKTLKKMKYN